MLDETALRRLDVKDLKMLLSAGYRGAEYKQILMEYYNRTNSAKRFDLKLVEAK